MANLDNPHGFRSVRNAVGGEPGRTTRYKLAAANLIIGVGDVLVISGGYVDRANSANPTNIIGIAAEEKAANDGTYILVEDNPMLVFEAQCDDTTGALTDQTAIGKNANIVVGNAVNGQSIMEIDESSGTTGSATLPLKIVGLYADPNNAFGQYNRLLVMINNHVYKSTGVVGN